MSSTAGGEYAYALIAAERAPIAMVVAIEFG
jgi:hypothetical protein